MELDPYKPPEAKLDAKRQLRKKSIGWKIYLWLCFAVNSLTLLAMLVDPRTMEASVEDYVISVTYYLILIPIYGFAYDKPLFSQKFWRYSIPLIAIWDIWFNLVDGEWLEVWQEGYGVFAITLAVVLVIIILQYIALFRYAFKENHLWQTATR